jgi:hypothetical protein
MKYTSVPVRLSGLASFEKNVVSQNSMKTRALFSVAFGLSCLSVFVFPMIVWADACSSYTGSATIPPTWGYDHTVLWGRIPSVGLNYSSSADTIISGDPVTLSASCENSSSVSGSVGTFYPMSSTTYYATCHQGDGFGGEYTAQACINITVVIVSGSCGSANGGSSYNAPSSGLCSSGSASAVSGPGASGPWTWSCYGSPGGSNAGCSAQWARNGVCGPSNGGSFLTPPTAGLCSVGSKSGVSDPAYGPYAWTCSGVNGGSAVSCSASVTPPVCGPANGVSTYTAPASGFCSVGTYSGSVSAPSTGPFSWSCSTNYGMYATSCSAPRKIDAQCGSAQSTATLFTPSGNLCTSATGWTPSNSVPSSLPLGNFKWNWTCYGLNGGSDSSCNSPRLANGICGSASTPSDNPATNKPNTYKPSTIAPVAPAVPNGLCTDGILVGTPASADIIDTTYQTPDWTWTCRGQNGGSDASCHVWCVYDCSNANHCSGETAWKVTNQCGKVHDCTVGVTLDALGTRSCNLNWTEIQPWF